MMIMLTVLPGNKHSAHKGDRGTVAVTDTRDSDAALGTAARLVVTNGDGTGGWRDLGPREARTLARALLALANLEDARWN